jgi:hypothetical protein
MDLDGAALRGVADLTLALERECRLIDGLHHAVLQQREAVAQGDMPGVESSIRLASRALLTLQENQRYRATLLHRLVGDPAQPLADLDARFEATLPETFLSARRRMRSSATEVAEEVWRNQAVLLDALRERDALLQELLTGSRPTLSTEPPPAAKTPEHS